MGNCNSPAVIDEQALQEQPQKGRPEQQQQQQQQQPEEKETDKEPQQPEPQQKTRLTLDDFEIERTQRVSDEPQFGVVTQAKKKDDGNIYTMKVLNNQDLQVARTQTERKVLENMDHPFIISLRYWFMANEKVYMILDYHKGGTLFHYLKRDRRFSQEHATFYAAEMILALEYLHSHNIIYGDLMPESIIIDGDGHARLADFELSQESISGEILTHTFCHTPEYLAPEVIQGSSYGKAVDWWQLGTLLYEMLVGLVPFYSQDVNSMQARIMRGVLRFPHFLSDNTRSLLSGLLNTDPAKRLGAGENDAEDIKNHPFFQDIDFEKILNKEIPPPFKPGDKVVDTSNVEEFSSEPVQDTIQPPKEVFGGGR